MQLPSLVQQSSTRRRSSASGPASGSQAIDSTSSAIGTSQEAGLGAGDRPASGIAPRNSSARGARPRDRGEFAGKRALIIEDDRSISRSLCKQLQRKGFDVSVALSAAEAIEHVKSRRETFTG